MTDFSIYMDKRSPPAHDFLQKHINSIYPKTHNVWIDSKLITKCQKCFADFWLLSRKHHCRVCGCVFCSSCCYQYVSIPLNMMDIPKEEKSWNVTVSNMYRNYNNEGKKLVCIDCEKKIRHLVSVQLLIDVFGIIFSEGHINLEDLITISKIPNKNWRTMSIYWLSRFRNIQYVAPDYLYKKQECAILWNERHNLINHENWLPILIKASLCKISYINDLHDSIYFSEISELIKILKMKKEKKYSCHTLMCSRRCNLPNNFNDFFDIIIYITTVIQIPYFWNNIILIELFLVIINIFDQKNIMTEQIPLLSVSIRKLMADYYYDEDNIFKLLDKLKCDNLNTILLLMFETNYLKKTENNNEFKYIIQKYAKEKMKNDYEIIVKTIHVFTMLSEKKNFQTYIGSLPILYPFDPTWKITKIKSIVVMTSNSEPLLFTFEIKKNDVVENKKMILKKDVSLRKENIVSSVIITLQKYLISQAEKNRIASFTDIPAYKVFMISNNICVVEFVENSITLREINEKQYTLQNYILEKNADASIKPIRENFYKSLAISSCFSYMLGLGDRHLDNIMINRNGLIFHIDYCYIMENPSTNIFGSPVIKITSEMIDFLGGESSVCYSDFKKYIISVFDLTRVYSNIILNYYYIFGYEEIIDWSTLKEKISGRFLHSMSCKDVEIALITEITNSSNSYVSKFNDFLHAQKQSWLSQQTTTTIIKTDMKNKHFGEKIIKK